MVLVYERSPLVVKGVKDSIFFEGIAKEITFNNGGFYGLVYTYLGRLSESNALLLGKILEKSSQENLLPALTIFNYEGDLEVFLKVNPSYGNQDLLILRKEVYIQSGIWEWLLKA